MLKKSFASVCALFMLTVLITGCGGEENRKTDIHKIYTALEETELLPPMIAVSQADMKSVYGIDCGRIADYVFYVSENTGLSDEVAIFETNDTEYADILYDMLVSRVGMKARRAEGYDAGEYAKCQKTSVIRTGNYVYFIVNDGYDTLMKLMRSYIG